MTVARNGDSTVEHSDDGDWRNALSRRAAKASAGFYGFGTAFIAITIQPSWQRLTMTATGLACCVLVGIIALTDRPTGAFRAWLIVVPAIIVALSGFVMVGFLSGPSVLLTVTMTLGGLLLGKRAMMGLLVAVLAGLGIIAWAMIHSVIPAPNANDVSMTLVRPWIRTVMVMLLAIGLLGSLVVEIVAQMERLLRQARQETSRREEAERSKARAEILSLSNKQLETIGQLAAGVAHDFNNNLAVIIGSAELLKAEPHATEATSELVQDILASSQRAAELTRQLLAYSRKAQMVLLPTDLHQLIGDTVALLRRSIDPCVRVETQLNAENATVLADASLLSNALLNLLVNARDAMPRGGQLTIATSSYEVVEVLTTRHGGLSPGQHVLIEILDTGEGIPADVLPSIFDPFFTTKAIGKGTGLGLAAVAGTVKSLRGSIEVESESGCGTAFRILLPTTAMADSAVILGAAQLTTGSGRVLLVDDDALVRRAAVSTLQSLGYDVTVAIDGVHALEVFQEATEPFAVVILDLRMPRMGGEATFAELNRRAPNLPILIWSGFGGDQDVEALLRKGAAGYIQKPYRIIELSQVVHEAINGNLRRRVASGTPDAHESIRTT